MSVLTDFYQNEGRDAEGRTISDLLNFSFNQMESIHDYIQWMFPLNEPSMFNTDAPLLTAEDIVLFQSNDVIRANFLSAIDKFLAFLGIELSFLVFSLSADFERRKYTWFQFNHNSLRITRFLSCLTLLGYRPLAADILAFMVKTAGEHDVVINEDVLEFWHNSLEVKI